MKYYNYPEGRTYVSGNLDSVNTAVVKGPDGKYIVPNELPAVTPEDAGKIVRVKADGTGIEYTGEAELPPITSSDGGKVCKVKDDHSGVEWGEAGGGAFVTTFTITIPMPMFPDIKEITADHTPAEVIAALNAGKVCIGIEGNDVYSIVSSDASDQSKLVFGSFNTGGSKFIKTKLLLGTNYTWDLPINGDAPQSTLIVNVTKQNNSYVADKTYAEVVSMFPNVIIKFSWYDTYTYKEQSALFIPYRSNENAENISFITFDNYWLDYDNYNGFSMTSAGIYAAKYTNVIPTPPTSGAQNESYVLKYVVNNWAGSLAWVKETT